MDVQFWIPDQGHKALHSCMPERYDSPQLESSFPAVAASVHYSLPAGPEQVVLKYLHCILRDSWHRLYFFPLLVILAAGHAVILDPIVISSKTITGARNPGV